MKDAAIGVFDSGVGGLTVVRAIRDQLPNENILYVGDTAHSPYGPRPIADVRKYSLDVLDFLVEQDVKLLVIACNTASSAVLRDARERYPVPVVEVIQPAVRRAMSVTKNYRIGIIGTTGTIASGAYQDAFIAGPEKLELFPQACPRFVEFVESGITRGRGVFEVAREYLEPLQQADIDTLILGCTHYPFLSGAISYVMGEHVNLVSSHTETALDVYRVLVREGLDRPPGTPGEIVYETTGLDGAKFRSLAQRFIGQGAFQIDHIVNTDILDISR